MEEPLQMIMLEMSRVRLGQKFTNDRTQYDEKKLAELAASIQETNGLIEPIVVRLVGEWYEVVAGHRRFLACQMLKRPHIEAVIRELTDEQASDIMLAENVGREDLDPIDECYAYQRRIDDFGYSTEALANKTGRPKVMVDRRLSLQNLIPEAQDMVRKGQLLVSERPNQQKQHAELLAELDPFRQRQALRLLSDGTPITLPSFRRYVKELAAEQNQSALFDLTTFWQEQVKKETARPLWGPDADTAHVPDHDGLPVVRYKMNWTGGEVIQTYLEDLKAAGCEKEAAAVGRLYKLLVKYNWAQLPRTDFAR